MCGSKHECASGFVKTAKQIGYLLYQWQEGQITTHMLCIFISKDRHVNALFYGTMNSRIETIEFLRHNHVMTLRDKQNPDHFSFR